MQTRPRRFLPLLLYALLACLLFAAAAHAQSSMADMPPMPGMTAAPAPQPTSLLGRLLEVYTPRRFCMFLEPDVIWTHVISDTIIALSYFTIPIALIYFVRRRKDVAFNWVFVAFAVFIIACGTTHIFSIIAIWHPYYRLDGYVKAITAIASIITAVALWPLLPKAIALPSPSALRLANQNLQALTNDLEERVRQRTADLETANASLREEIRMRQAAEDARERLLTSEKSARAEAEHANRLKDEFVATLSHELRTPINAVMGWTQILKSPATTSADVSEGLSIIERNVRVQVQLIEDLLDMSRILSGKLRLDVRRVDLSEVVRAAIGTVTPSADAKSIRIHSLLDPDASTISGDANRLQQVVWNLLANAIKFTPKGGQIHVRLQRIDSHLEITVSDTGIGINPDFLPHVFERFRQADGSITRLHGGLGLGLAIVKHLVELHGGSVNAQSAGDGQGAAFTVLLPLPAIDPRDDKDIAPAFSPSIPADSHTPSLKGLSVLIVDDEPDSRLLIRRVLEAGAATVLTAGSASDALRLIADEHPSVIISDIGMPTVDGYAFLRSVRSRPAGQGGNTPAIALTAYARAEDRRKALLAGFQMHLPKPVDPQELIAVVASVAGIVNRPPPAAEAPAPQPPA